MVYTLEEKYQLIKEEVQNYTGKDPLKIITDIMHKDFISIHGPEHHFLDGASFLMAFKNVGGKVNIEEAINELASRGKKMPGAMCGYWGVCGSISSIGAVLAIIHGTGPLTDNDYYKDNMEYTSESIHTMSKIGGPRCCKRNAFLSIMNGVRFVKEKYGIEMEATTPICDFSFKNQQCIKERCPFYKK